MTQLAVARPLSKPDLGHQFRTYPASAVLPHQPPGERRGVLLHGGELLVQAAQRGLVEAGTHLGGIAEVAAVVIAEEQRAQLYSAALRAGVAADDEFLVADAFEFQPI